MGNLLSLMNAFFCRKSTRTFTVEEIAKGMQPVDESLLRVPHGFARAVQAILTADRGKEDGVAG